MCLAKFHLFVLAYSTLVLSLVSCSESKQKEDVAIKTFSKEEYYKNSPELPDRFYNSLREKISDQDSALLCSRLSILAVSNLSADLLMSFESGSLDSIKINGVISFDQQGVPFKDTVNYEWLLANLNSIEFIDSVEFSDGDFQVRIQLEKICSRTGNAPEYQLQ